MLLQNKINTRFIEPRALLDRAINDIDPTTLTDPSQQSDAGHSNFLYHLNRARVCIRSLSLGEETGWLE